MLFARIAQAIRRLGELMAEMPKATGHLAGTTAGPGTAVRKEIGGSLENPPIPTLAELGINKKPAHKARQLAAMPAMSVGDATVPPIKKKAVGKLAPALEPNHSMEALTTWTP